MRDQLGPATVRRHYLGPSRVDASEGAWPRTLVHEPDVLWLDEPLPRGLPEQALDRERHRCVVRQKQASLCSSP